MNPLPRQPDLPHAPRIVIPVVAGIGNALLAVPMVRQLKRKLPDGRITMLARIGPMAEVFRRLPEVDETIVTGKGIKGLLKMLSASRARRPDVFLVPFPSNRWQYALLALASGAKVRVMHGYDVGYWRAMHFLPARRVPAERGLHDVRQNLNLLTGLGLEPDPDEPPTFPLSDDDRARAAAMLRDAGVAENTRPIVVHAGSAQTVLAQAKRWPAASYAALVRQLAAEHGDRVVLVEGPDEAGVAAEILQHLASATAFATLSTAPSAAPSAESLAPSRPPPPPKVIRLAGPLGDAAALLERAELYVGSDSGLGHLAAAVGTPAVTLFAPADPDRVCPFGNRDRVIQPPVSCTPCMQYPWHAPHPKILCRAPYCITQITVDAVSAKARETLALAPAPARTARDEGANRDDGASRGDGAKPQAAVGERS